MSYNLKQYLTVNTQTGELLSRVKVENLKDQNLRFDKMSESENLTIIMYYLDKCSSDCTTITTEKMSIRWDGYDFKNDKDGYSKTNHKVIVKLYTENNAVVEETSNNSGDSQPEI